MKINNLLIISMVTTILCSLLTSCEKTIFPTPIKENEAIELIDAANCAIAEFLVFNFTHRLWNKVWIMY